MKKFILSLSFIVSFGGYVIWQNINNSNNSLSTSLDAPISTDSTTPNTNSNNSTNSVADNSNPVIDNPNIVKYVPSSTTPTPVSASIKTTTPVAVAPKKKGLYKNGTYIGDSVFAYNDNVQVKVIISNEKLYNIQFVTYPTRGRSGSISSYSLPILKKEAIAAQNANIDAVSGASYTSPAFIQSLASALDKAKA